MRGVRVGHAGDPGGQTGVTVVRFDRAAIAAVDVRGGASCTYDVASLDLASTFGRRWAIFLSGGSLFGLDAARGVRTQLLNDGEGHHAFSNPNLLAPVSGACLFDLPAQEGPLADYLPLGFAAAASADSGPVVVGAAGAGLGARVGKYLGRARSMRGAVGSSAVAVGRAGSVGALVVVNAVGAVRDPTEGHWVAGATDRRGRIVPPASSTRTVDGGRAPRGTTLVVVATDVPADRRLLQRVAIAGQSAVARAVVPAHTATDGDVVFACATREQPRAPPEQFPGEAADRLGNAAAFCVETAIVQAARLGAQRSRADRGLP